MKKVSLSIILIIMAIFIFPLHAEATEIGKKCVYNSSTNKETVKMEITFQANTEGTFTTANAYRYYRPGWQLSGDGEKTTVSLSNLGEVMKKFQETGTCPSYILEVTGSSNSYYPAYSNEEHDTIAKEKKTWSNTVYSIYFDKVESLDDGKNPEGSTSKEFVKKYYPNFDDAMTLGNMTLTIKYDEVNAQFKQQMIQLTKVDTGIKWAMPKDVNKYIKDVLEPIVQKEQYPTDLYCGKISAYVTLNPQETDTKAEVGEVVCATSKSIFLDSVNTVIHFQEKEYTDHRTDNDDDDGKTPIPIVPIEPPILNAGEVTCESLFKDGDEFNDFGKLLQGLFTFIKFLAPVFVIAFSSLDYIKAITSKDAEELKKANERFIKRLIAGVIIFLLPFILDFVFDIFGVYDLQTCGIR